MSDPTEMLLAAEYAAAMPQGTLDPDTEQALFDKQRMERIVAAAQSRQAQTNPPADAYTETNHGLQALPHIQNDGG